MSMIALAAAAILAASGGSNSAALDKETACQQRLQAASRHVVNHGRLSNRQCALELLQKDASLRQDQAGKPIDPTTLQVAQHVGYLGEAYMQRASRQQSFLDAGSLVTFGSAAAAFEGGISASTRQAWTIAALVPSIVTRFNANEPTRELFHGAALALHLMTVRQTRIERAIHILNTPPAAPACQTLDGLAGRIATRRTSASPTAFDTDGVLLGEARRLVALCGDLRRRHALMTHLHQHLSRMSAMRASDFASDVLAFDQAILAQDRDLRYTPLETVGLIVSSPLRSADLLVSGENTQVAVDSLKTQIAFAGLNRSLASIPVPTAPPPPAIAPISVSSAANALDTGTLPPRDAALFADLRSEADQLEISRYGVQLAEQTLADLTGALAASELTFSFDVTSRTTLVRLAPPAPPGLTADTRTAPTP